VVRSSPFAIGLDGQLRVFDTAGTCVAEHRLTAQQQGWQIIPAHHERLRQAHYQARHATYSTTRASVVLSAKFVAGSMKNTYSRIMLACRHARILPGPKYPGQSASAHALIW
jgi:hypothetical protein